MESTSDVEYLVLTVTMVVTFLVSFALYLVTAAALSKVFAKLGADAWKAWVPLLNIAEIFALTGRSRALVLLYLLPIANTVAAIIQILAMHDLNRRFGRGAGMTFLAIVLPPAWAIVLSRSEPTAGAVRGEVSAERAAGPEMQVTGVGAAAASPAAAMRGLSSPVESPGDDDRLAADDDDETAAEPVSGAVAADEADADEAEDEAANADEAEGEEGTEEPPSAPANPWAPAQQASAAAPQFSTPAPAPVPAPTPKPEAPAPPPQAPTLASPPPDLPTPPPAAATPVAAPATPPATPAPPTGDDDDDDLDETVMVDRRAKMRWTLVVDGGAELDLPRKSVIVGRRPSSSDPAVAAISVPDPTKTLSKVHARLEPHDDGWTITDLNSTNGVLVGDAGAERTLEAGVPELVVGRFVLGELAMHIQYDGSDA